MDKNIRVKTDKAFYDLWKNNFNTNYTKSMLKEVELFAKDPIDPVNNLGRKDNGLTPLQRLLFADMYRFHSFLRLRGGLNNNNPRYIVSHEKQFKILQVIYDFISYGTEIGYLPQDVYKQVMKYKQWTLNQAWHNVKYYEMPMTIGRFFGMY